MAFIFIDAVYFYHNVNNNMPLVRHVIIIGIVGNTAATVTVIAMLSNAMVCCT